MEGAFGDHYPPGDSEIGGSGVVALGDYADCHNNEDNIKLQRRAVVHSKPPPN